MTIFKHEMKQNSKTLIIWTLAVGLLSFVCLLLFSEMKTSMGELDEMFASMGDFTKAFGMDQMSMGTLTGFYGIECGNILGLGGSFLAALLAVNMLSKEEGNRTAEFLLAHPISRVRVITEKLIAIATQLAIFNIVFFVFTFLGIIILGEKVTWGDFVTYQLANYILQLEIVGICYGISAFIRKGSLGIGLGIAAMFYFLNIVANISENAKVAKYITPFSYTEASEIFATGKIDTQYLVIGIILGVIGVVVAYIQYSKKDIMA
ncbi:ABC transporter permease subunit [Anaerosporobacter sp.]|uniref:ABC transporter permease subunit n=1 Tax=Anaerosporobacter sp. TaxID=1872529 RepID=UPI00286EBF29|nr:ABC transporter permease subunit [Anaerosporobacter sp.]